MHCAAMNTRAKKVEASALSNSEENDNKRTREEKTTRKLQFEKNVGSRTQDKNEDGTTTDSQQLL